MGYDKKYELKLRLLWNLCPSLWKYTWIEFPLVRMQTKCFKHSVVNFFFTKELYLGGNFPPILWWFLVVYLKRTKTFILDLIQIKSQRRSKADNDNQLHFRVWFTFCFKLFPRNSTLFNFSKTWFGQTKFLFWSGELPFKIFHEHSLWYTWKCLAMKA